uniref:Uncharacterized protein n=1 Tax=viral metagenome TaxID=1070528 RepID=A0A6M3KHN5_9ZZZZ
MSAPHGSCYKCEQALTRIEARDRSHVCAPHPLAEVKAFQKRERAKRKAGRPFKTFYVSGHKPCYHLCVRVQGYPFIGSIAQFERFRYAQHVANALNDVMPQPTRSEA